MKLFRKIIIILLIITSCQNSNPKAENPIIKFDLKKLPKITNVKLSDLGFVDIEYIPLETNETCMISYIMDIKFGKGFFLVQSFNKIIRFQDDGLFTTKIGTEGRGPNEFTHIHDFDIDKKNQNIYLVSAWQKRFFVYSDHGEFIRTFQCPQSNTSFKTSEDGILCYNINSFANVESSYNLIDNNGRIIKSFPNKYPWKLVQSGTAIFDHENIFYRFNNRLLKKEIYSDTVYLFDNMNFKPYLVIEQGEKLLTTKARSDFNSEYLFENFITQNNLFEFGDYIFYEFGYGYKIGHKNFYYGFIGSKKEGFQTLISEENGITNDLDGGPNIWPKTIKDGKTIIGWIDAIQLKTHIASEAFKNSKPNYPEKKKELEKLANSLKETDNPVLMLVRLKK